MSWSPCPTDGDQGLFYKGIWELFWSRYLNRMSLGVKHIRRVYTADTGSKRKDRPLFLDVSLDLKPAEGVENDLW